MVKITGDKTRGAGALLDLEAALGYCDRHWILTCLHGGWEGTRKMSDLALFGRNSLQSECSLIPSPSPEWL